MGSSEYTVLVEIKTPDTPLMASSKNRSNSWRLSSELIDAQSQILEQRASFQAFAEANPSKLFDKKGEPITQKTLNPKVILVIGRESSLSQAGSTQEREIKTRTFELYRRELSNLTVLTYDELYERASHILAFSKDAASASE